MGVCFSKKKTSLPGGPAATSKKPGKVAAAAVTADDNKANKTAPQPKTAAAAEKNAVKAKAVVVTPGGEEKEKKNKNKRAPQEDAAKHLPVVVIPSGPVRTSSCTKEEVDAILIQCGRLSRSSSGTGRAPSGETAGGGEGGHHRRRRSGSKRSYDFDQERKAAAGGDEECDWESRQGVPVPRPSPHRGSPQRKRSGSRERSGGGGSRRASRSPGRRAEGGVSSAAMASSGDGERARQPGKMVSVPAREKGRAPSPAAASGIRCASPRSSSPARMAVGNENACGVPATGLTPALSRSSSRKAEQSPYRRNPMAELDENTLRNNNNNNGKPHKKSTENTIATAHQKATERGKEPTGVTSCRSGKEKPEIAEGATVAASDTRPAKTNGTRTPSVGGQSSHSQKHAGCRSRRASRDLDQSSDSYASQILEDIQNYHEQHQAATTSAAAATLSFSLPACVAKACSIVEAVADLNSSSSDNRTYDYEPGRSADDKGSVNAMSGTENRVARRNVPAVRDVRAEAEPQESAGSNSVSAIPCTPSWEPVSGESTDRTWSAGDEVVDQAGSHGAPSPLNRPRQSKQKSSQLEPSGRSRAGSVTGNSLHRGRSAHRGSGSVASGRSGVRPVSAAS